MVARKCWVVCMACVPRAGSTSVVALLAKEGAVSGRMCIPRSRIALYSPSIPFRYYLSNNRNRDVDVQKG